MSAKRRELLENFLLAVTSVVAFLLICEIVLRFLPVSSSTNMMKANKRDYLVYFEPNREIIFSSDWDFKFSKKHKINNYGFVNAQDYWAGSTLPLISVVGDSYVEAFQVSYEHTFHGRLSRALEGRARVYSFAGSDAPLSQYLKWAQYSKQEFDTDRFIFCIIANDFDESDVAFSSKPVHNQFVLKNGEYRFFTQDYEPSRTKLVARNSALIRYLVLNLRIRSLRSIHDVMSNAWKQAEEIKWIGNVDNTADELRVRKSKNVADTFLEMLPKYSGLEPEEILFVVDTARAHIYGDISEEAWTSSYFESVRRYFLNEAVIQGYEVLDLDMLFGSDFEKKGKRFEFPYDSHWNEYAHKRIFEAICRSRFLEPHGCL